MQKKKLSVRQGTERAREIIEWQRVFCGIFNADEPNAHKSMYEWNKIEQLKIQYRK